MNTPTEALESPYLDGELEFVVPTNELSDSLTHAIDECPFAHLVGAPGTETSQSTQSDSESQEAEMLEFDEPVAETWTEEETGYEADEAFEAFEAPAVEHALPPPRPAPPGTPVAEVAARPRLRFVSPSGQPYSASRYSVLQDGRTFEGSLAADGWTAAGVLDRLDPARPFRVHVEGGVCCIVEGAALQVAEAGVEYGGSFVDWTAADEPADFARRDQFWKEYKRARQQPPSPQRIVTFLQHDHVMRRSVKLLARRKTATFQVQPISIRLGPIVRYTDARRALVWIELETPALVRVTYGRAAQQRERPAAGDAPPKTDMRHACSVRVGGRHYALVWLDGLQPDTGYQYTLALAPQPIAGPLPLKESDFTEVVFPRVLPTAMRVATDGELARHSYSGSPWLFVRTLATGSDGLRFAHGSCRKYPNDTDPNQKTPGPDLLDLFGDRWLAKRPWAEWPRFFLHTGDQIYADDIGVRMCHEMLAQRASATLPGPAPQGALDIAYGAWAGRFGWRHAPFEKAGSAMRADYPALVALRPRAVSSVREDQLEWALALAKRARSQPAWFRNHDPRTKDPQRRQRYRYRILNGLLWQPPDDASDAPRVDIARGASVRQVVQMGPPVSSQKRSFDLEYPAAGDNLGVHAADYAEYAALHEQAFGARATRRLLAHLPSYMIFDDHEVTDDWNADKGWLRIVHSPTDHLRCWPMTMTDALCAYWIYQGWGNLAPERWAGDARVQALEGARREGRDALPALRRLVLARAVEPTAPDSAAARRGDKLDWHYSLPTPGLPFHVIDLRTDRDVNGAGGMSSARLAWIEQSLAATRSPVAVLVLPTPFLMPDPMLFAFRNPSFTATLAGARSTTAFKRGSDLEHPAENRVWDDIKGLLKRLQALRTPLKSVVLLSGDIHFSCNFDGQVADSNRAPRLVQLISSGLRQVVSESKQRQLDIAYRGWLNAISRAQGVDEHRGIRITLGGLHGPGGRLSNFLFKPSAAIIDITFHASGPQRAPTPLVVQTHVASAGDRGLESYSFRHMTQADGSAVMSLKDPGFAHPTSPKDYPAATGGIGIAREADEVFAAEAMAAIDVEGFDIDGLHTEAAAASDAPEVAEVDESGGAAPAVDAAETIEVEAADTEAIGVDAEIIGRTDDRVHVADTNVVPWRWVCALDLPLDDPGASRGSGVLVGPRHLLTAAHVLPRGDPDKLAKVRISPARNGDNADHPFGAYSIRRVRYPWRNVDLALVTLDRELPAALGFWGHDPAQAQLRALARDDLIGKRVTVSGYPGDRCNTDRIDGTARQKQNGMRQCMKDSPRRWASTLWRAHGTARVPPAQPFVFYDADTYRGQSGGPVALSDGGVHVCVGIHVNGTPQSNWGVRLTPAILGDVRDAINADAGAAIASVVGDALVVQAAAPRREAFSGEDEALPWPAPMTEREAFEPLPELEGFEEVESR